MSHEIAFINGRAQMAYLESEGLPWHGLGEALKDDEPLEVWAKAAGLEWEAVRQPVFTFDRDGALVELLGDNALCHSETGRRLGFITDSYNIVQPKEILNAYNVIAGAGGYKLHTAGNLRGGSRIWALADCGEEFYVDKAKTDKVKRFILMATSFDGSMATIIQPTTVRVVCQNTFSYAVGGSGENAKIRISHHSEFEPGDIRAQLLETEAAADEGWTKFKEQALQLADRRVTLDEAIEFFTKLFVKPDADGKYDVERAGTQRKFKAVMELYAGGKGQDTVSAQGTAWGLVNTVTRWADHERATRSDDGRLDSAWFGNGADMKQQAFTEALALAA